MQKQKRNASISNLAGFLRQILSVNELVSPSVGYFFMPSCTNYYVNEFCGVHLFRLVRRT